ncbi:zinc ribbon domain-containing protein [Stygiolobus caldivivus]|uniref:Zinc-ribbon domain-containing protein n=1 Tax=Stygiolobus caldivivus TaxID=2824673 RepID=A0A8D5ZGL4_9CREN|nr:zinc ribbon domain-containing protein [Stygiolobus caldivivus]BCU68924.1 hypothetical protein KN1_02210 [Stygiolobus caldivivus]
MTKYCPKCGTPNPDEAVFCGKCGFRFPPIQQPTPLPQQPQPAYPTYPQQPAYPQQTYPQYYPQRQHWTETIGGKLILAGGLILGLALIVLGVADILSTIHSFSLGVDTASVYALLDIYYAMYIVAGIFAIAVSASKKVLPSIPILVIVAFIGTITLGLAQVLASYLSISTPYSLVSPLLNYGILLTAGSVLYLVGFFVGRSGNLARVITGFVIGFVGAMMAISESVNFNLEIFDTYGPITWGSIIILAVAGFLAAFNKPWSMPIGKLVGEIGAVIGFLGVLYLGGQNVGYIPVLDHLPILTQLSLVLSYVGYVLDIPSSILLIIGSFFYGAKALRELNQALLS